jgi:hypothetical protein
MFDNLSVRGGRKAIEIVRDGGILDYHLDIPFLPDEDGRVLYPHFYEHITPGWFDKSLNRKPNQKKVENVVLVVPSKRFVESLPFGKIREIIKPL